MEDPLNKLSSQEETRPVQEAIPPQQSFYYGFALAITFIAGLAIGFLGRPLMIEDLPIEVVVTVVPNARGQAVAQANEAMTLTTSRAVSPIPSPTIKAEDNTNPSSPTPTIMDFVLSDARHFQGSDDAPVTLVEFSDFK